MLVREIFGKKNDLKLRILTKPIINDEGQNFGFVTNQLQGVRDWPGFEPENSDPSSILHSQPPNESLPESESWPISAPIARNWRVLPIGSQCWVTLVKNICCYGGRGFWPQRSERTATRSPIGTFRFNFITSVKQNC